MELKETIKELKLINDINTKSLAELSDEYLSSDEKCDEFIKEYGTLFLRKGTYQLRIAENYEKILELLNYGKMMYPKKEYEDIYNEVNQMMIYNLKSYDLRKKTDDLGQAQTLFLNDLGANKCKKYIDYDKMVSKIYVAAQKYELKGKYNIRDFKTYLDIATSIYDKRNIEKSIDKYFIDHPLMRLCKDKDFLFFANYMLKIRKDLVDEEFLDDIYDVIATSSLLYCDSIKDKKEKEEYKDYKKLAKYTLKNISIFKKENSLYNNKKLLR